MKHKNYYKRNLPHYQPKDGVFAITACLKGSLPKAKIETLRDNRDLRVKEIENSDIPEQEKRILIRQARNIYFGAFDALLDKNETGPTWLSQPEIANIVEDSLHFINDKWCKVVAYSIMSNHIHLVLYKCEQQLFKIMGSFKRYTGTRANEVLYGKCPKGGEHPSFWQAESYDHQVRDRSDFYNQVRYTLNNPVKAGLVASWEDWKWCYLREEFKYIM